MYIEELVDLFKKEKYKVEAMFVFSNNKEYKAYSIKTRKLYIGIFDYDYPNTSYNGKIVVDHKELFDKWSKCFYKSSFPNNEKEFKVLLEDIKYCSKKINYEASDMFCTLTRSF